LLDSKSAQHHHRLPQFPCSAFGAPTLLDLQVSTGKSSRNSNSNSNNNNASSGGGGGSSTSIVRLVEEFPTHTFASWGRAKAELRRRLAIRCKEAIPVTSNSHNGGSVALVVDRCAARAVSAAAVTLGTVCGDLKSVESVVAARADGMGPSDISEHLWQLRDLAKQCDSVLECGVRGGESSWAILLGLLQGRKDAQEGPQRQEQLSSSGSNGSGGGKRSHVLLQRLQDMQAAGVVPDGASHATGASSSEKKKRLYQNDIDECANAPFKAALRRHEGEVASMSFWKSDLELDLDRDLPESEGGRVDMLFIDTLHVYGQVSQLVHAPVVPSLLLSRMHSFTHSCTH
jgi:hypothetical protein